jgi:hypothetical protein
MVTNARVLLFFLAACLYAQTNFFAGRPLADAHNCYPYEGHWSNRLDRALSFGFPVAIEQDLAWAVDHIVVSHTPQPTGAEPTLQQHFFERVRPIVEQALRENRRETWPIIVLHFDFKDNQPALLHAVWNLLGEYESWITTAQKNANPAVLSPFDPKPLLVLTEDSDAQEQVFFKEVPSGARLRLFGSAHTTPVDDNHLLATLPVERLLTTLPTNYRRWWNNSWYVVEEGGAAHAGDWTPVDQARLRSLIDYAHRLGYWVRFYTLDGFTAAEDQGWGANYNFGSLAAARLRWQAARDAGVNLIATDQYEALGAFLK